MPEIRTEWVTLSSADGSGPMPCYVAVPADAPDAPGLMVFQEAFGVNPHIRDVTERFAREGYAAIAPALFHRTDPNFEGDYNDFAAVMPHMQALTNEGIVADAQAAFTYLSEAHNAAKIGAIGYCLGGRAAFLAATGVPDLKAAASYYGGGIAPNPRVPDGLLDRAGNVACPLLLVWGGKDTHLPPEATRAIDDALIAAGKTFATITFSDADHGFFCDARAAYNPEAAREAWPLTLAFLANRLK